MPSELPVWTQENFSSFLDAVPDAMLVVDSEAVIVIANAQAEAIFRSPSRQLLGRNIESLIPKRFQQQHPSHIKSYFADPRMRPMGAGLELFALRVDGTEFPVEISLSPLSANSGTFVIAMVRDITKRKQANEQIKRLNSELQTRVLELAASNQEMESFSYSVSHDLRAPLRQIDGFSKIVLDRASDKLDNESLACLDHVREGARRMAQLVDDLLNFSRLGRQEPKRRKVDLDLMITEIVSEFRQQNPEREFRWCVGKLALADCDPQLIRQVFTNLISNAVKFTRTRNPAIIEIGRETNGQQPVFWVKDNGVGFDMKYADKLFGVFQRLHLQEEFEGTGVGLANVQRIILKHGGKIWVRAERDHGATFLFSLPADMEGSSEWNRKIAR